MSTPARHEQEVPPTNTALMVLAGILLLIPCIAIGWVSSYSKVEPRLWGFPFFIWYQLSWVFLTAACTSGAYLCVKKARPSRSAKDTGSDA